MTQRLASTRRSMASRWSMGLAGALAAVTVARSIAADLSEEQRSPTHSADVALPSRLDYLVLASMADSPHLLSIARFHSTGDAVAQSAGAHAAGVGAAHSAGAKAVADPRKAPSHSE